MSGEVARHWCEVRALLPDAQHVLWRVGLFPEFAVVKTVTALSGVHCKPQLVASAVHVAFYEPPREEEFFLRPFAKQREVEADCFHHGLPAGGLAVEVEKVEFDLSFEGGLGFVNLQCFPNLLC